MKKVFSFIVCILLLSACAIKPIPITDQERKLRLASDLQNLFKGQEEIKGPITLYEAIARTLKYNMEYRVKLMEEAVERGSLKISKFDLLPALTANAGYHNRSKFSGATSLSLIDGSESLVASTSSEKIYWDASFGLSWNVLDFGVSFVRAKQQADQIMIANELRRKAIQNIVLDVTTSYWRAVAAQRVKKDFEEALKTTQAALERSEELETRLLRPPLKALENQQALLDLNQKLLEFRRGMNSATFQLAALMNLNPGINLEVFIPDNETLPVVPEGELKLLEEAALLNRSEVREGDYKKRINRLEVRKAMLQMLPGLDINATRNYTGNKYTYFPSWNELTGRITYNIFNLFSGPANIKFAKTAAKLEDARRMALNMAVLTQVHLSLQDYQDALQNYTLAKRQEALKERIEKQVAAAKKAETTDELQSILSKMRRLSAVMRSGASYAGLQSASARIYHTIGVDRVPDRVEGYDVPTLAKAVKASMEKKWVFQKSAIENVEVTAPKEMVPTDKKIETSIDASQDKDIATVAADNDSNEDVEGTSSNRSEAIRETEKDILKKTLFEKKLPAVEKTMVMQNITFADKTETDLSSSSREGIEDWVGKGLEVLDNEGLEPAINLWKQGIRGLNDDRIVLIAGVYRGPIIPVIKLKIIGNSRQVFILKGDFQGEKAFYLLSAPDPKNLDEEREFIREKLNLSERIYGNEVKKIIRRMDF